MAATGGTFMALGRATSQRDGVLIRAAAGNELPGGDSIRLPASRIPVQLSNCWFGAR